MSMSVAHSSSIVVRSDLDVDVDGVGEALSDDRVSRRYLIRPFHDPSKEATTRDFGTCLTLVHSLCCVIPSSYV